MREFTIKHGNYVGIHNIYDNPKEAEENGIAYIRWFHNDITTGTWVWSEDGRVFQCLRQYDLINKQGQLTKCYRFVNGTVAVFFDHGNVAKKIGNLYADRVPTVKSTLSGKQVNELNKEQYSVLAKLLVNGVDLYMAIRTVISWRRHVSSDFVNTVLEHPRFREAVLNEIKSFDNDIAEKFSDNVIIKHLDLLLQNSKLGTDAHRNNITFIMQLRGLLKAQNGKLKDAIEVPYNEEKPPLLL